MPWGEVFEAIWVLRSSAIADTPSLCMGWAGVAALTALLLVEVDVRCAFFDEDDAEEEWGLTRGTVRPRRGSSSGGRIKRVRGSEGAGST